MNNTQLEDLKQFADSFPLGDNLLGKRVLITGATGLIGSTLIHCILALDKAVKIIAPVRNIEKAHNLFSDIEKRDIDFVECDITTCNYEKCGTVDYIVHCAAPTSSRYFIEHPVETFDIIYSGTKSLLDYAVKHPVKGFVYLSSLEIYGEIHNDSEPVKEDIQGFIDIMSVRSCYPVAKRAAENMCCLYSSEYGVPAMIARLTQTTGAGIAPDDNRVIAQFARLAVENKDIILHTTGESARPYCYTTDAISAILYILFKGQPGQAYNIANEETYISARDMAEFVRDNFNPAINIRVEINEQMGYAPVSKQNLTSEKLRNLGWKPQYDLKAIYSRLINFLLENKTLTR